MTSSSQHDLDSERIRDLISRAEEAFHRTSYEESAYYWSQVQALLESMGGEPAMIALAAQNLADRLFDAGRYRDALSAYERLYNIGRSLVGDVHPQIVSVLSKAAKASELSGEEEQAFALARQALDVSCCLYAPGSKEIEVLEAECMRLQQRKDENLLAAQRWKQSTTAGRIAAAEVSESNSEILPDLQHSSEQDLIESIIPDPSALYSVQESEHAPPSVSMQPPVSPDMQPPVPPPVQPPVPPPMQPPVPPPMQPPVPPPMQPPVPPPMQPSVPPPMQQPVPPPMQPPVPPPMQPPVPPPMQQPVPPALATREPSHSGMEIRQSSSDDDIASGDSDKKGAASRKRRSPAGKSKRSRRRDPATELRSAMESVADTAPRNKIKDLAMVSIPVVSILLLIGLGIYLFTGVLAPSADDLAGSGAAVETRVKSYSTADELIKLELRPDGTCEYSDQSDIVSSQWQYFDGSWKAWTEQIIGSLTGRQYWFSEVERPRDKDNGSQEPADLVTDAGIALIDRSGRDWLVLEKMESVIRYVHSYYQSQRSYPAYEEKILGIPEFIYKNPYSGEENRLKLYSTLHVTSPENDQNSFKKRLASGTHLGGEVRYSRGEVRCYAERRSKDGATVGVTFYVRGCDGQSDFFRLTNSGKVLVLGEKEGKPDGSMVEFDENNEAQLPTVDPSSKKSVKGKIWIALPGQPPIFIVHHIVPITLLILSFLAFWRGMMLRPDQSGPGVVNHVARGIAVVSLLLAIISIALQIFYWR